MTRLAHILAEQKATYASVAREAGVQPRTLRQIATGETPLDSVQVGTVRRIASALGVSPASLIEPETPKPGDPSLDRATRLSRAIADPANPLTPYPTPVDHFADPLADVSPDDFFADMPPAAGQGSYHNPTDSSRLQPNPRRRLAESLAPYLPDDAAGSAAKLSISLPKDLLDDVRAAADERGATVSATIAAALRKARGPEPEAPEEDAIVKRLLPARHWFAVAGLAKIRSQTIENVLVEAVDAWLTAQGIRLVRDDEWRRQFGEFLARRSDLADQNKWTDEEIEADIAAAVKEVREGRAARRP